MIVICEECGKKYRIDPEKIKGRAASFRCRACSHVIMVSKPKVHPSPSPEPKPVAGTAPSMPAAGTATTAAAAGPAPAQRTAAARRVTGWHSLRTKMLLLFLLIPTAFLVGAILLYFWQVKQMTRLLTDDSTRIVRQMAEKKIAALSGAVAIQCRLYLLAHPELKKQDFMKDMGFKTLAVQKVGLTGYTALYERPDAEGVWRTWAHVNPKIIGIDMSKLKKHLGKNFPGFWKIFAGVKGGKRSQGYYTWQDKDGVFRDKFMVCTPVAGTRFVVAATTYIDEFTAPLRRMEARANELTARTRLITWVIFGGTLLIIGLIVFLYGQHLAGKIRTLTDVAERISIGELDIEVQTGSRDEIGELAEAIERMQESIRLSIERLRRRR